jgi:hypothetical protein
LAVAVSSVGLVAVLASASGAGSGATCDGRQATKVGTPGNDSGEPGERPKIVGTNGSDVINGLGGDDVIVGHDGRDHLCGGRGGDQIYGGGFGAVAPIESGGGADRVFGGSDDDILFGGGQNDDLFGFAGDDHLFGGKDDDALVGGDDSDDCDQNAGSGSMTECEADLSVEITGPDHAPPGQITFTFKVKNKGPSNLDSYRLNLAEDNTHLNCGGPQPWEGTHLEPALRRGDTQTEHFTSTCTDPDPTGLEKVHAKVRGGAPADDPVASNDTATKSTVVS